MAAILIALALWQLLANAIGNDLLLVTPVAVLARLAALLPQGAFWKTVGFTFLRIGGGFVLALLLGAALAALAGRYHWVEVLLWPYMAAVKATPVASFIILCLIWLSSRNLALYISFLIVVPVVYTNVLTGIRETDPKLLQMAHVFQMSPGRRMQYIYRTSLRPYVLSAVSVGMGLAWKSGTAAEVIGIPAGSVGEKLYMAKVYFASGDLLAWTVVIVAVSLLCEKLVTAGAAKLLSPVGKQEAQQ